MTDFHKNGTGALSAKLSPRVKVLFCCPHFVEGGPCFLLTQPGVLALSHCHGGILRRIDARNNLQSGLDWFIS